MYSSIMAQERARLEGEDMDLFRSMFLPSIQTSFLALRRQVGQTLREISEVLGDGIAIAELTAYEDFREPQVAAEQEKLEGGSKLSRGRSKSVSDALDGSDLRRRLDKESGLAPTPSRGRSPAPSGESRTTTLAESTSTPAADVEQGRAFSPDDQIPQSTGSLLQKYHEFRDTQQAILADLLIHGKLKAVDDELRVDRPRVSMAGEFSTIGERRKRANIELKNRKNGRLSPIQPADKEKDAEKEKVSKQDMAEQLHQPDEDLRGHGKLLLFVTSFMFLSGQFARHLSSMHDHVITDIKPRKKKHLHVHIFEKEKREGKGQKGAAAMPMHEALAVLEGRTSVPVKRHRKTPVSRFLELESFVRSDISLGALKTTAAVSANQFTKVNSIDSALLSSARLSFSPPSCWRPLQELSFSSMV